MNNLLVKLQNAKKHQPSLALLSLAERNKILISVAELLKKNKRKILSANGQDLKNLQRMDMRDRLVLNDKRLLSMEQGLQALTKLPDSLNKILEKKDLKNGLHLSKISVPLGVVAVIYESRPNVTIDLAGLAIKTGNALVLKGGSEAHQTNKILTSLIHQALAKHRLSPDLVYLIDPKESWQKVLLNAHGLVDVLIPRGSSGLIEWVRKNSRLPIIETGAGVCHIFVDDKTDPVKAAEIIVNAKTQRPDVCNALDTVVIHRKSLNAVMSELAKKFIAFSQWAPLRSAMVPIGQRHVEIFADDETYRILKNVYPMKVLRKAKPTDFGKEFLSLKMSIKTVGSFEEGLEFVKQKTSGHSESILSKNPKHIARFLNEVDAAVVYQNASTRFTDGGEFGMGAEVGISTQKLHARGPMGLEALTSYKWVAKGNWLLRK
jgi:glutamate-5-semialdehyde dehydrogenase